MEQTAVIAFDFESHALRGLVRNGEPWFVVADVARVLDLGRTDDAVRRLDPDEKGADTVRTPGGPQTLTLTNESGLYSLIFTSRKPAAKRFKKWVTAEVLPALRRTGRYAMPGAAPAEAPAAADAVAPDEADRSLAQVRMIVRVWGEKAAREIWNNLPGLPPIPEHLRGGPPLRVNLQGLGAQGGAGQGEGKPRGNLDLIAGWWFERLSAGTPTEEAEGWPEWIATNALYRDFCAYAERLGVRLRPTDAQFGIALGRLLSGTFRRMKAPAAYAAQVGRVWGYALPDLTAARRHMERLLGEVQSWGEGPKPACEAAQPLSHVEQQSEEVERFLKEATVPDPRGRVQARTLYLAYCAWECSGDPMSETAFGRRLVELAQRRSTQAGVRYWEGLRLSSDATPFTVVPNVREEGRAG